MCWRQNRCTALCTEFQTDDSQVTAIVQCRLIAISFCSTCIPLCNTGRLTSFCGSTTSSHTYFASSSAALILHCFTLSTAFFLLYPFSLLQMCPSQLSFSLQLPSQPPQHCSMLVQVQQRCNLLVAHVLGQSHTTICERNMAPKPILAHNQQPPSAPSKSAWILLPMLCKHLPII